MTKREQKYLEYLWKVLGGLMESKELLLLFIYYTVYLWGKSFAFAEDCGDGLQSYQKTSIQSSPECSYIPSYSFGILFIDSFCLKGIDSSIRLAYFVFLYCNEARSRVSLPYCKKDPTPSSPFRLGG